MESPKLWVYVLEAQVPVFGFQGRVYFGHGASFYWLPPRRIAGLWLHPRAQALPSARALLAPLGVQPQELPPGIAPLHGQVPSFARCQPATEGATTVIANPLELHFGFWAEHNASLPTPERETLRRLKQAVTDDITYRLIRSWSFDDWLDD
jgi:hypothetical protein